MKRIFTLLLFLSIGMTSYSQSFVNKPLIAKRTADWCPNCGTWGWDFKLAILENISSDKATIVALHYSGGLVNPVATALVDNIGGAGQPRFYLNETDLAASSSNWDDKLDQLIIDVDAQNATVPDFGIELHAYPSGVENEIISNINLHVNQSVDGEYYLGTYLITNDLVHNQAGNAPDAEHKKILLDAFSDDPFGVLIGNGPILEGVMNFDVTKAFANVPDAQTDVAVIIWKKEGDKYAAQTSGVLENVQDLTSTKETTWIANSNIQYFNNEIKIDLESTSTIGDYRINLFNTEGKLIYNEVGAANSSNISKSIDASVLAVGNYFVNVITNKGKWADNVVVVK